MSKANADPNVNSVTTEVNPLFISTQRITTATKLDGPAAADDALYPPEGPVPAGITPSAVAKMESASNASADHGSGIEGETIVWEGHYSMRNFLGRLVVRAFLSLAWVVLAIKTWGDNHANWAVATITLGVCVLIYWGMLLGRMAQARYGHYYRLTNRRLFVSTGLMRRRRDQMELLRVKNVFTKQSLRERWLSLGTVVVVSTERELPPFSIAGIEEPKEVMDLVWHEARSERDNRSANIHTV